MFKYRVVVGRETVRTFLRHGEAFDYADAIPCARVLECFDGGAVFIERSGDMYRYVRS